MDPDSSPYIIPNNNPYNPFPHSLLSTRESIFTVPCKGLEKPGSPLQKVKWKNATISTQTPKPRPLTLQRADPL